MTDEERRRRIEDLIHDYAHAIDDDRLEEWPGFFTADCRYLIISRENHAEGRPVGVMTCEGRGMLEDRITALRKANIYEPHRYRHLISAIRLRGMSDGAETVETSYAVLRIMEEGETSLFSSGKYLDRIVFEGGEPKFKERLVVFDSRRVHTLLVIPL
jgi:anthranilate 1,2-dioxygenase small subunit